MKTKIKTITLGLILSLTSTLIADDAVKANLIYPTKDTTIESQVVSFEWDKIGDHGVYQLIIGTTEEGDDIYSSKKYYIPRGRVTNIPINGKPIYVKLGTNIHGRYEFNSYVIPTKSMGSKLISPAYGLKINTDSVDFEWDDINSDSYHIEVGTTEGGHDLIDYKGKDTSITLSHVPKGKTLYVKLTTQNGEQSITKTYQFGAGSQTVIDAIALYTPDAKEKYPDTETRISHAFNLTNKIFKDSGLNAELHIKAMLPYDRNITNMTMSETLRYLHKDRTEMNRLKDMYGADTIVLYRTTKRADVAGIAYGNSLLSSALALFVVQITTTGSATTAHELGHTMGLHHDATHWFGDRIFNYARGHGENRKFATVMAYGSHFNTGTELNKFSSPNLDCLGSPCGIEEGEPNEADAVKALQYALPKYSNFRAHIDGNKKDEQIKKDYEEAEQKLENLKAELKKLNDDYLAQRKVLNNQRKLFKNAKKEFVEARDERRKGNITKEELATIKATFVEARKKLISERTALKNLYNAQQAKQAEVVEAESKFKELEAKYLALK